ncbi:DUF1003 domain-containing protein [archaeon]|nr:DUF1003 domain-containing protein [archaeon]
MEKKTKRINKRGQMGIERPYFTPTKFGERAADNVTRWAGSWTFILSFLFFLGLWMATNVYAWLRSWDPYPFILLNLVLSCIAALQAPIILMSQNRAAQKDRQRAEYDYAVNRRAEREIQAIQTQLDRIEKKLNKK